MDIIADELNEGLEERSTKIQKGLAKINETTSKIPGEMGKEFGKRMKDLFKDIAKNL